MQSVFMPYRPEPGEVVPVENELIRHIRRETEEDGFVLWRGPSGWVVSFRHPDGMQVDAAFCGVGEVPSISQGGIGSLKSFAPMARNPSWCRAEAGRARKVTEQRESRRRKALQEKQEEYDDLCRFVRRQLARRGDLRADLPWLRH